jgi:tetratricopeptide (TPR) repeat protein
MMFGYCFYTNYTQVLQVAADEASRKIAVAATVAEVSNSLYSDMTIYAGAFFLVVVVTGLLAAHDLSHFFAGRVEKLLFDEVGDGITDPEYERAEHEWANGHPLEAIRLMREFLKNRPREIHAALRIAEIYEKDLQNYLAASLEYEEVLKHKLPAERWGWSAIHLCNLYFKLNQQDKAVDLLRRIDEEYGQTAAAEKARQRLAMYDSDAAVEQPMEKTPAEPLPKPVSNLPPGFTPKKL